MTTKQNIADFALSTLEKFNIPAILLRGTDEVSRVGGDIDLIVPAQQSATAALLIGEAASEAGWALIGFKHLGYVAQICLLIPNNSASEDLAIKIDLSDGLNWYSLGDDVIGNELFRLHRTTGSYRKISALATFFQKMLYPGYLREKDISRIYTNISVDEIHEFCVEHNLPVTYTEIKRGKLKRKTHWSLRASSCGAHKFKKLSWLVLASILSLKSKLGFGTESGITIGVAGMDGCGKSTLVDRFVKSLHTSEFSKPELVHLLPKIIPTPHQIIKRKVSVDNYTRPYSEPSVKSPFSAALRLGYYFSAFLMARLWCSIKVSSGTMVVFDRSVIDFAADLDRARIPHMALPIFLIKLLLPTGVFFYLDAKPETVIIRKGELTFERASKLSHRYLSIAESLGINILNSEKEIDTVYMDFICRLTSTNLRKIRKHINNGC